MDNATRTRIQQQTRLERRSFLAMLIIVTIAFIYLITPFFGAVFWACTIGLIFHPLYVRLLERFKGRRNFAASATLATCIVIGVIPTLFVLASFVQQGAALYKRLQSGGIDPVRYIEQVQDAFPKLGEFLSRLGVDLNSVGEQLSESAIAMSRYAAQHVIQIGQGTLHGFISIGLMLYIAYFILRDGRDLVSLLVRALPLGDERERLLFLKFSEVTRATIKGNLVVATVQGALGGIIFWVLGIPGAVLWGVLMTLLSLIPVVGAGLIWAPVAIYFFATGNISDAIILSIFGVAIIGLVDNILRPILVGRDTKLPDYLVLLSTLGGIVLFGLNGFVLGPLLAALFVAFWGIFIREFNIPESHSEQSAAPAEKSETP